MRITPIVLASLSSLMGCGILGGTPPNIQPQEPNAVSLDPQNWYTFYSAGVSIHPSTDPGGAWSFEFPSMEAGGHVNYMETPLRLTTIPNSVSVTFKVESNAPQYIVLDPGDIPPATVHLFFEQQNDDLVNANGRWWAQTGGYNCGSQDNEMISFTVPLSAAEWTNVYGQFSNESFGAALANVGWIGLTFGGQYFWGHGVALAGGSAKFILINMQIN
jgi:hypothetical protein